MIVKHNILGHWKMKLLIIRLGREAALVALLSLWGYCEERRAWEFKLTPLELAGLCDYAGDPELLFSTLLETRIIDRSIDPSWFTVHAWEEVNKSLVDKWRGGKCWHPRGFRCDSIEIAKAPSIDPPIDPANGHPIGPAIGLDGIGLEVPPVVPQGGQGADASQAPAGTPKDNPLGDAPPPGKKGKGGGQITAKNMPVPAEWSPARTEAMRQWLDFKAESGKGYKPLGFAALVTKLAEFSDAQVVAAVQEAKANNWAGLFPERSANSAGFGPQKKGGPPEVVAVPLREEGSPDGWELAWAAKFASIPCPGSWTVVPEDRKPGLRRWLAEQKEAVA